MEIGDGVADLHLHTPASDGTDSVERRISQALDRDLDAIAITDHDVIDDQFEGRRFRERGIEVLSGVEIRADLFDTKIELLGYYVDPHNETLQEILRTARAFRRERNRKIIEQLNEHTQIDLNYENLRSNVRGNLGRPHVAEHLVKSGVVDSIGEAFDEYLAEGGDAFVPMERLSAETVIDAIHSAGGAAALAHPGRIRSGRVREMVEHLAGEELDGIEVWYPYGDSKTDAYADIGVEEAHELAHEHDLIPTGGSDCHGEGSGKFRIGSVRAPSSSLAELGALVERRTDQDLP